MERVELVVLDPEIKLGACQRSLDEIGPAFAEQIKDELADPNVLNDIVESDIHSKPWKPTHEKFGLESNHHCLVGKSRRDILTPGASTGDRIEACLQTMCSGTNRETGKSTLELRK